MTGDSINALSPKKLLHTKWTALVPRDKEKHFLVTKVIEPSPPGSPTRDALQPMAALLRPPCNATASPTR